MNLSTALASVLRRWRTNLAPSTVPDFPLRCQHCEKPIQLVGRSVRIPLYRDRAGFFICETNAYLPHRPMPSVLG